MPTCRRHASLASKAALFVLALAIAGCRAGYPTGRPATPPDWTGVGTERRAILERAHAYATHEWRATADQTFDGIDPDGVPVTTPDAAHHAGGYRTDGSINHGVAYQCGGFSTIESFDAGRDAGAWAGHIYDPARASWPPTSAYCVGVDCSGFVSRAWGLPVRHSTRALGRLGSVLPSFDDLEPGDLINKFNTHCMLFAGFVDETRTVVIVYESVFDGVVCRMHDVATLRAYGFVPIRVGLRSLP